MPLRAASPLPRVSRRCVSASILQPELRTVAARGHDLDAAVEHRLRISGGDHHLLREADVTPPRATLVWERLPCYVPLDLVRAPLILQLPNVLRQRL